MNRQQLRDAVRSQTDLDEDDVPNAMVDLYLDEAFEQTAALEQRWPFFEQHWEVQLLAGESATTRPSDLEGLVSVRDRDTGARLLHIAHELAEDNLIGNHGHGVPRMYSTWGGEIVFWPGTSADRTYRLRGWRKPAEWAGSAGSVPDLDERLHRPLVHYAVSRVYAHLEDPELEQLYFGKYMDSVERARKAIMRPDVGRPLVLSRGLGFPRRIGAHWRLQTP